MRKEKEEEEKSRGESAILVNETYNRERFRGVGIVFSTENWLAKLRGAIGVNQAGFKLPPKFSKFIFLDQCCSQAR